MDKVLGILQLFSFLSVSGIVYLWAVWYFTDSRFKQDEIEAAAFVVAIMNAFLWFIYNMYEVYKNAFMP